MRTIRSFIELPLQAERELVLPEMVSQALPHQTKNRRRWMSNSLKKHVPLLALQTARQLLNY